MCDVEDLLKVSDFSNLNNGITRTAIFSSTVFLASTWNQLFCNISLRKCCRRFPFDRWYNFELYIKINSKFKTTLYSVILDFFTFLSVTIFITVFNYISMPGNSCNYWGSRQECSSSFHCEFGQLGWLVGFSYCSSSAVTCRLLNWMRIRILSDCYEIH